MKKIVLYTALLSFCVLGSVQASEENWCYDFKGDIVFSDKGSDVDALKKALTYEGLYKAGWESESFDVYIAAAVMGFQDKYKDEILKPIGLTNPTGSVSRMTIKKLNALYGCGVERKPLIMPVVTEKEVIQEQPVVAVDTSKRDGIISNAVEYIKKYLAAGMDIVVSKTEDVVKTFYRFEAKAGDMTVPTYVSTDGKIMTFQETDLTKEPQVQAPENVPVEIEKKDKPKVELFVMSHCPYGTQMEKGIIPVIETLGDGIDFELKFCDYAMHGEIELKEQLSQYCIQKEQKEKLLPYLKCFLKEGKSSECIVSVSIDKTKLDACIESTDKEYKVMDNFKNNVGYVSQFPGFDIYKDDNMKYGVQGSPTLVINGNQVQSGRDSAGLLKTICSGFVSVPEGCNTVLPADNPTPGFGEGTTSQNVSGGCQ